MSEFSRLLGVLIEPVKAFADIVARPKRWWIPLILTTLTVIVYFQVFSNRVGWDRAIRHELESNSRIQQLEPDKREQAIQTAVKFSGISASVAPVIFGPIGAAIMAGILMLVLNGMFGAKASFIQSLAITTYSGLVSVVLYVLAIVVMMLKDPNDFDYKNPLAFNLGALVPSESPKWLSSLAGSFDVFSFWSMALLAIGFAATSPKLKASRTFTGIAILWLVLILGKAAWVGMMG